MVSYHLQNLPHTSYMILVHVGQHEVIKASDSFTLQEGKDPITAHIRCGS